MRLVSALYNDWYPFDLLWPGVECVAINQPDDLRVGDMLIVWGGGDIHPSLYQHPRSSMSGASPLGPSTRDEAEWAMMRTAKLLGVPIIGVCRGAQMLCALAGGSLIQHVDNHVGNHLILTHDGHYLQVNSLHHQMMNPTGTRYEEVARTVKPLAPDYNLVRNGKEVTLTNVFKQGEPEFLYFPDVHGFAIQWHPEMMDDSSEATAYIKKYVDSKMQGLVG